MERCLDSFAASHKASVRCLESPQSGSYLPPAAPAALFRPKPGELWFLDGVANACRIKHLAYRTEQAHVGWAKRFILFYNSPEYL
jgi:hypothetical protein